MCSDKNLLFSMVLVRSFTNPFIWVNYNDGGSSRVNDAHIYDLGTLIKPLFRRIVAAIVYAGNCELSCHN